MSSATWEALVAAMTTALEEAERAVDGGTVTDAVPGPALALPVTPLPAHLRERVESLRQRTDALATRVAARMAATRRDIAAVPSAPTRTTSTPSFLDARA